MNMYQGEITADFVLSVSGGSGKVAVAAWPQKTDKLQC